MHLNGENKNKIEGGGGTCWEYANGQKICKKIDSRGLSVPAPWLYGQEIVT